MSEFWEGVAAQGIGDFLNHGMNFLTNNYWTKHQEEREDTAVSRYARDLERAGLSKTLAAGGQAHSAAPVVSSSARSDYGDLVMRNSALDIAKRQQDNQDMITQAQLENINAQSDLIRANTAKTSTEAGISQQNLSSYEQRLAAEMAESASRISQGSQRIAQSEQEITNLKEQVKTMAQGRTESQQRISESQSRIRLNASQIHLNNQAISKGEYAMRLLAEEISNTRRTGAKMDLEYKLKQMDAIRESVKSLYEMKEGNYHKSLIGKITTDLIQTFNNPIGRSQATTAYMEAYNELLNDIK